MGKAKPPIIHVVDGSNWLNRAYHATPRLHASDGTPTNAIKAFESMISVLVNKIKRSKNPYLAIAFDEKKSLNFRSKLHERWLKKNPKYVAALAAKGKKAGYKGNRSQDDEYRENFLPQIPWAKRFLKAAGIPVFSLTKYEADDIIGTFARIPDTRCMIYSRDKDFAQLLDRHTRITQPAQANSEEKLITASNCIKHYGVHPDQFVDYLLLNGDGVDNIAGVEGCGPKTAVDLLTEFGSIDNIIANADKLKGNNKVTKAFQGRDKCVLPDFKHTRKLATIVTDVPGLPTTPEGLKLRTPDLDKMRRIKSRLELSRLLYV